MDFYFFIGADLGDFYFFIGADLGGCHGNKFEFLSVIFSSPVSL